MKLRPLKTPTPAKIATVILAAVGALATSHKVHAAGALAPGTRITNTASVSYALSLDANPASTRTAILQNPAVAVTTFIPHPLSIRLGTSSTSNPDFQLPAGVSCLNNGVATPAGAPHFLSSGAAAIGQPLSFQPGTVLKSGDPLFIEVYDNDANAHPLAVDHIDVTVTAANGDSEVVRLMETAIDSARFIGYIQTTRTVARSGDCTLSAASNEKVTVSYVSSTSSQSATVQANILVDPLGQVFNSVTGKPVNGSVVSLINADTGLPAKVFGDDGVSQYPSTMVAGSTVSDSAGTVYNYGVGQYRFPLVQPGNYRIVVNGPQDYVFPTQFDVASLATQFGSSFVLSSASKGTAFPVASSVVVVDLPVDSTVGKLLVNKTASTAAAAIGDFVRYKVTVTNQDTSPVNAVTFRDVLPAGFRLQESSFRVNTVPAHLTNYSGTGFTESLGTLAPGQTVTLNYVTEVTVQTPVGRATNTASATGVSAVSNNAIATVDIRDELLSSRSILIGNVLDSGDCKADRRRPIRGARILFETGDSVLTDTAGMWHQDHLTPGDHVARLDMSSLPEGYEPVLCEDTPDFAGDPTSRFVNGMSASMRRVDFYVRKTRAKLDAEAQTMAILLNSDPNVPAAPGPVRPERPESETESLGAITIDRSRAGTEAHSYHDQLLARLKPEQQIVFPTSDFSPTTTAIGVAVSSPIGQTVELRVNGVTVSASNFDGLRESQEKDATLHYWSAVDIKDGMNRITAVFFDANHKVVGTRETQISFSSNITKAVLAPERSRLVADGKTAIEVAVRLTDEFGRPAYKGLSGTFTSEGQFSAWVDRLGGAPAGMLGRGDSSHTFVVGDDGVAILKLEPSSNGGEARVTLALKDKRITLRPWVSTASQPWILVGFAQGTWATEQINAGTRASMGGVDLVDKSTGRVAFYGKGEIQGDLLATIAYDSQAKDRRNSANGAPGMGSAGLAGSQNFAAEDVFMVYGDESFAQKDAKSAEKLYVRIERDRFYAMFGDTQTGLTVTELTGYDRNITGLKTEYHDDRTTFVAFASEVTGTHQVKEIQADALSGAYRTGSTIKPYSDVVSLVTRSKSQRDRILTKKTLSRFIDYEIDYDLGTIRLHQSADAYDYEFNPQFVHVEYDVEDLSVKSTVTGGRVAYAIATGLEAGVSAVREDGANAQATMQGIDLRFTSEGGAVTARLEAAESDKTVAGIESNAQAYYAEGQYKSDSISAKAYAKQVGVDYGTTSTLAVDAGLQKTGVEAIWKLSDTQSLQGQATVQQELATGASSDLVEARLQSKWNERASSYIGLKHQSTDTTGLVATAGSYLAQNTSALTPAVAGHTETDALIAGAQYALESLPARLVAQMDLPQARTDATPERLRIGGEYDLRPGLTFLADREVDQYEKAGLTLDRVGVKASPWKGAQIQASAGALEDDAGKSFYKAGIDQTIQLDEHWSADFGYAHQSWQGGDPTASLPAGSIISLENFDSVHMAAVYKNDPTLVQMRAEYTQSDTSNRTLLQTDYYRRLNGGYTFSSGFTAESTSQVGTDSRTISARAGGSYRKATDPFSALFGLKITDTEQNGESARNVVVNAMENYKTESDLEFFAHQGVKQAYATFDGQGYKGTTVLLNGGVTKNLSPEWDLSFNALNASSMASGASSSGLGLALTKRISKDGNLTIGYQSLDRYDRNFAFNESYREGIYVKFTFKFNENSFR